MFANISFIQENLLAIVALVITLILIYHYLIERDHGVRLSKRYRHSIFEVQSKIFLNATQYLISGQRDLAIKEFLNAVDINKDTVETYFALGGLFRSNGEIEKAIGIHRSIIARENISENTRLRALNELAIDFDRGGFIDKAIETFKDVLKINRDQDDAIEALCRIYENISDWDNAYSYRLMLSKVSQEDQSETISHILVEKSKKFFLDADFATCKDLLQEAFKFAPSIAAKLMELKVVLMQGDIDKAKFFLLEILHEHPTFISFLFESLNESSKLNSKEVTTFKTNLEKLFDYFLEMNDPELGSMPAVVLTKIRILKERARFIESYELLKTFVEAHKEIPEYVLAEYVKILIMLKKFDIAAVYTEVFLSVHFKATTKHYCKSCGYNSDEIFWRCPQCYKWETIQFRWKL